MAEIRVIRPDERSRDTPQTAGVVRNEAISATLTGSSELWMGLTTAPTGMVSGVHHHGDSETALYVERGNVTFFTGEGLRDRVDAGPGDFVFIGPGAVHVEANFSGEEAVFIVARSTQEAIVVNLDDVDAPGDLIAEAREAGPGD